MLVELLPEKSSPVHKLRTVGATSIEACGKQVWKLQVDKRDI